MTRVAELYKGRNTTFSHVRPYAAENTGSRPLSPSQTVDRWISSWVGDDQRIPGVVRFFFVFLSFFLFPSSFLLLLPVSIARFPWPCPDGTHPSQSVSGRIEE